MTSPSAHATQPAAAGALAERRWRQILTDLDRIRATAWATGDPALLERIYLPGSRLLAEDQANLRDYLRRGFRVRNVHISYLTVRIDRVSSVYVALSTTDVLRQAVAVSTNGATRPLPRDLPTGHRITLRRIDGAWRISTIASSSPHS